MTNCQFSGKTTHKIGLSTGTHKNHKFCLSTGNIKKTIGFPKKTKKTKAWYAPNHYKQPKKPKKPKF